jgi:hypothetical protein
MSSVIQSLGLSYISVARKLGDLQVVIFDILPWHTLTLFTSLRIRIHMEIFKLIQKEKKYLIIF